MGNLMGIDRLKKESAWEGKRPGYFSTKSYSQAISRPFIQLWLGGPVGWSVVPCTERLPVPFPVRAHV